MDNSSPEDSPQSERAPSEANVVACPVCGKTLTDRQQRCSAKCRAALSRQLKEQRRANRDAGVRLNLEEALRLLAGKS
jgi:predicted nucleic acid-binding Zn ribbon protein